MIGVVELELDQDRPGQFADGAGGCGDRRRERAARIFRHGDHRGHAGPDFGRIALRRLHIDPQAMDVGDGEQAGVVGRSGGDQGPDVGVAGRNDAGERRANGLEASMARYCSTWARAARTRDARAARSPAFSSDFLARHGVLRQQAGPSVGGGLGQLGIGLGRRHVRIGARQLLVQTPVSRSWPAPGQPSRAAPMSWYQWVR